MRDTLIYHGPMKKYAYMTRHSFSRHFFILSLNKNDQDIIVNDIEMLLNNIDTEREREGNSADHS